MKKYLLLIATVAVFAACAEKEQINETTEIPIDFTKSYIENVTKAPYTTANFATTGNTMGVFGWKQNSTNYTQVFNDQSVDYNQTASNDWGYSPKKYWDSEADKYIFYAYAPHSDAFTGTVTAPTSTSANSFAITNFTQVATVANQIDLLVDLTSQINNQANKSTSKPKPEVAFTFNHILTQVNIVMGVSSQLKGDESANPVAVQSVTLNDVNIKGTYSYNNSAWGWSAQATPTDFSATTKTVSNETVVFGSTELETTAANVPGLVEMLLIPGSVSGYTITVNYTIGDEAFEKTINLTDFKDGNNTSLSTWAIGYNYIYSLTIGPEPIEFASPTINGWGTGGTYSYTIE